MKKKAFRKKAKKNEVKPKPKQLWAVALKTNWGDLGVFTFSHEVPARQFASKCVRQGCDALVGLLFHDKEPK
jgi:hypothetical protein